uniref:BTB domain-containing protein n=1 Tax=Magallana gigas TaxID=29159 RepID=A0A8W8LQN6_MAGGI
MIKATANDKPLQDMDEHTKLDLNEVEPFADDENTTDVVLCVEEKRFHLSRGVLMLASPVFREMLNSNGEGTQIEISLPEESYKDFVLFLKCFSPTEYVKLYANKLVSQTSLHVAVYTGQLDVIVNTLGTLKWVSTLDIYGKYFKADGQPFPCPQQIKNTCGFVKTYKNFSIFWIMNAGHMVPKDNGAAGLEMVKRILRITKKQK